ncbi:16S rRNA (cytidine(1402)-2'-O)-methyltransferase [Marimonas arenosa]|uniref:Ribosomal RNA small subunit methyltransferase I n=1 Tax=Marimonas arenosa TaxID=1795305 RepID=A0AAE3WGE0_9RHOB|nr:16S rRNA (cytidine(1402)-2'-O)-methyltransferase [Marimonas arenosa]MDQ2092144.1 16S rRNA (cytidine(1402)-2'-O)-methyltransferase [Marimonas arenosa]
MNRTRDEVTAGAGAGGGLAPGLWLVATPIGAARDITLRALDILAVADVLAAEDTRSLRRLMEIHGLALSGRPLIAYHEHSGEKVRAKLLQALAEGKSVAYAPEAGTAMISDPGFDLARAARAAGHAVHAAPGASAAITALTLSGLPTDRFLFAGFLPATGAKRKTALAELADVPATLIFYESPRRIAATLKDAAEVLGGARRAALCRELTKKFEEVVSGTLDELAEHAAAKVLKGEIVFLVDRGSSLKIKEIDVDSAIRDALRTESVRDAADRVARETGRKRREIYQRALVLVKEDGE